MARSMSPSKRPAKSTAKRAAKPAAKPAAAGGYADLSNEALQDVLAGAVRVYSDRVQAGDQFRPFKPGSGITATDVMVTGTQMMRAVGVQLFEFGMWQAWSGNF
jgi:hypothetical protein